MKVYELPTQVSAWIEKYVKALGFSFARPQVLAKAILEVSNDYQDALSVTPWSSPEAQMAYLCYFFPLNYVRFLKVIDEGKKWNFWQNSQSFFDFGCGPGTLSKALLNDKNINIGQMRGMDQKKGLARLYLDSPRTNTDLQFVSDLPDFKNQKSILGASYILNEIKGIPDWFFDFEKLVIIEPSTRQAFPKLVELRDQLIQKGYFIVAPCTHSHQCPLKLGRRDWCHDRVHWKQPDWFSKIERELPIKNNTLTHSYLLASRQDPRLPPFGRIVGDAQVEKGKTRWMICQGPEREFLSHLKKQGAPPEIYRGDRVQLKGLEKRGNEIRFELEDFSKID